MRLVCLVLLLSGCTVSVVDGRLTREEVATALHERDANIEVLAQKVMELSKVLEKKK